MKPNELLAALELRDGLTDSSLARKVDKTGKTSLQSQIHKFRTGTVIEPRRSTIEPLAAYFNIATDAFYKTKIATAVAKELGLQQPPPEATMPKPRGQRRSVGNDLGQIAERLAGMSPAERTRLLRLVDGLVKPEKQNRTDA